MWFPIWQSQMWCLARLSAWRVSSVYRITSEMNVTAWETSVSLIMQLWWPVQMRSTAGLVTNTMIHKRFDEMLSTRSLCYEWRDREQTSISKKRWSWGKRETMGMKPRPPISSCSHHIPWKATSFVFQPLLVLPNRTKHSQTFFICYILLHFFFGEGGWQWNNIFFREWKHCNSLSTIT